MGASPATNSLPDAEAFGLVYEHLLKLADSHLVRPISTTIDTWEDGTFRIVVYHQRRPDERECLYYHSDEGTVRYGVEAGDSIKEEHTVDRLEPGMGSTVKSRN